MKKLISLFVLAAVAAPSFASGLQNYSAEALSKAKAEGKTIVLGFHSTSCGTCLIQKPALDSVLREEAFADVVGLSADIDNEKALAKEYKVKYSATLVLFKGNSEVARETGITKPDALRDFLNKGN